MLREVDLKEISDGKLYRAGDLVKVGCNNCQGCSDCCRGMGDSVILDPLDVARLSAGLGVSFDELLAGPVSLRVVDGLVLPYLKMEKAGEACTFLNEEGRCSIHAIRPGFCRLFPLGRYYEETGFSYFLQVGECSHKNSTKEKVRKWIGEADWTEYEQFVWNWHSYQKKLQQLIREAGQEKPREEQQKNAAEELQEGSPEETKEQLAKRVSMTLLQQFYIQTLPVEGFYRAFKERLQRLGYETGL